jgi:hypothetical protein
MPWQDFLEILLYLEIQQEYVPLILSRWWNSGSSFGATSDTNRVQCSFRKSTRDRARNALIIKRMERFLWRKFCLPQLKACSFERIYFSRGSDAEIYQEEKETYFACRFKINRWRHRQYGVLLYPNTAETSFYGLVEAAQDFLNQRKNNFILQNRNSLTKESLQESFGENTYRK